MSDNLEIFQASLARDNLEWIRSTISRMSDLSQKTKAWTITITTALAIFLLQSGQYHLLIGLPPILVFMVLDAYYLALERHFRFELGRLTEAAAAGKFSKAIITAKPGTRKIITLFTGALVSPSIIAFYGLFICLSIFVSGILLK